MDDRPKPPDSFDSGGEGLAEHPLPEPDDVVRGETGLGKTVRIGGALVVTGVVGLLTDGPLAVSSNTRADSSDVTAPSQGLERPVDVRGPVTLSTSDFGVGTETFYDHLYQGDDNAPKPTEIPTTR